MSQLVASLARKRVAERGAEICDLPWTQTEKDNALAKCRLELRAWRSKKPMLCLHAVTDEDGQPLEMGFRRLSTGVLEGWVLNFYTTRTNA